VTLENERVSYAAGTVGIYTLLSRVFGLVRDVVVAWAFGAGMTADAFFVAFRIPNLLRRLFAEGSLTIAFIPVFTEYLHNVSREDAVRLARGVLTILTLLLVIVALLGVLFAPWIVRVQAFGFGDAGTKYELTVLLTRITFPYILLISLVALFMGILNSLRHFAAPAAAPIFLNVGIIVSALLVSPHLSQPIVGLALGVLLGGLLQLGLQIPWLLQKGVSLVPLWIPRHPAINRIGHLMVPAIFGSAVYQINGFIQTLLASFLDEGSVSWLYYADRIVQFPLGVFAIAISTAALPSLSKQAAQKDMHDFRGTLDFALRLVFFISIPSSVGLLLLGRPIVEIIFERGAFNPMATAMTTKALFYYTLGLWAFSGTRVLVSAFYALQDTRTPVKVAIVVLIVNLALSLALMGPLRHGGLAFALSLASILQFILLFSLIRRKVDLFPLRPFLNKIGKYLCAAVVMAAVICGLMTAGSSVPSMQRGWLMALQIVILVFFGAGVYFIVARLVGCDEVRHVFRVRGTGAGRGKN
jgi:putative peptidoglycan lipid II flippase